MADGRSPLLAESPAMRPVLDVIARVGPVRRQRAHQRRERHRQEPGRAGPARRLAPRRHGPWSRSTPAAWPRASSRASSSATCAAPSPTPRPIGSAASSWPTAARSSSTRSPTCRSSQQAKLLRVIETGEFERVGSSRTRKVDVRIVSATNADLSAEVEAGRLPAGSAVPPQHHRDRAAAAARPARGHPAAGPPLPHPAHAALPQRRDRLRAGGAPAPDGPPVAGQRARTRPCHRARGADDADLRHSRHRSGAAGRGRSQRDASRT